MPSPRSIIASLAFLTALGLASPIASAADAEKQILIGVRDDAPPFVWTEAATGNHLGFFWDICTKAVERAGYQFSPTQVTASDRKNFLSNATPHYDLLCDPTTITISRMRNFSEAGKAPQLSFSPIVFVANGTYASPNLADFKGRGTLPDDKKLEGDCRDRYAKVTPKTDPADKPWIQMWPTEQAAQKQGADGRTETPPPDRFEVWGFVEGATIGDRIAAESRTTIDGVLICPVEFPSHQEAARQFCDGKIARYFGDADILRASIEISAKRSGADCPSATFWAAGTYEPYAFVTSAKNRAEFPERFSLALYEMYTDGTIDRLFAGHFPGIEKSPFLSTLFQINSIPMGDAPKSDTVAKSTAQ